MSAIFILLVLSLIWPIISTRVHNYWEICIAIELKAASQAGAYDISIDAIVLVPSPKATIYDATRLFKGRFNREKTRKRLIYFTIRRIRQDTSLRSAPVE